MCAHVIRMLHFLATNATRAEFSNQKCLRIQYTHKIIIIHQQPSQLQMRSLLLKHVSQIQCTNEIMSMFENCFGTF